MRLALLQFPHDPDDVGLIPGTVQVMSLPLYIFLVSAQSDKEIKGKGPLHEIITEHCV